MTADGVLSAVIWPNYVGACTDRGEEPISHPDYGRGMIRWDVMPNGELVGRAKVLVPPGMWTHILYCPHPSSPQVTAAQKLAHPCVLTSAGEIALDCITESDIRPLAPDPILHD